jgi:hypothetical protein
MVCRPRLPALLFVFGLFLLFTLSTAAQQAPIPGLNVNMVSGTTLNDVKGRRRSVSATAERGQHRCFLSKSATPAGGGQ